MIPDHATIQREGFTVPLIGIPAESVLEKCEVCGWDYPLSEVELKDGKMACRTCDQVEVTRFP